MSLDRRKFLNLSAAFAAFASASPALSRRSFAQAAKDPLVERALQKKEQEIIIAGGSGAYLDAAKKAFYDPFTEATGIRITPVPVPYGEKLTKLKAMTEVNRVEWDVVTGPVDLLVPKTKQFLRDLGDCSELPNVAKHGIDGACLGQGILFDTGGAPLVYSTEAFPDGQPQPQSWADFWDVERFPGPRALPNVSLPWWPLMAALQADGVPSDKLFPLDLDRAFKKMDEIKPHVTVWWKSGDQSQQIFRSKEVVMSMMYSGRALKLQNEGLPVKLVWNGAPMDAAFWAITKEAPHPNAAMAFFNFVMTRPEAHAEYARTLFYDTSNKDALSLLSEEERRSRASHPDNWKGLVQVDKPWVASNRDQVIERWVAWIAS